MSEEEKVIRLEIADFKNWGNPTCHYGSNQIFKKVEHPPVQVGNIDWIMGACVNSSAKTNNVKHLGVYVKCKASSRSNLWSCDATIKFTLLKLNSKDKNENFDMGSRQLFDGKNKTLDVPNFKNWQEAICDENHHVFDKKVVIEARILVGDVVGINNKILETFAEPRPNWTDVVLIVEGKKVHVGKQILAQCSEYFDDLFFAKKPLDKEIVIEKVAHSHFVDFLNFIYPSHKVLTAENVAHILKLANRFKVPYVTIRCENFLISSKDVHLVDKFKYAETYKLSALQDHCLDQIKTDQDLLELDKHENYSTLDGTTHTVILQKLVDVFKGAK